MKSNILLIALMFIQGLLWAQSTEIKVKKDHAPNEFLLQLIDNQAIRDLANDFKKDKILFKSVECVSEYMKIWHLSFDESEDEKTLLRKLERHPSVSVVQFNHYIKLRTTTPNDPQYTTQWHWQNTGQGGGKIGADVNASNAWDITTGGMTTDGDTIVVAVIDAGTEVNHPDLVANHWFNWKEIPNNGIDDDKNGFIDDFKGWNSDLKNDNIDGGSHGLSVEGIIGAVGNNNRGISGINWKVKIMSLVTVQDEKTIVAAYNYVLMQRKRYNESNGREGAYVVASNSSFGADGFAASVPLWCAAYDSMGRVGIVSVGSTDNVNKNVDTEGDIPSTCPSDYLIVATSSDRNDLKASDAAFGVIHVDVAAPGKDILTTSINGGYSNQSGTSFASPVVAGLVALAYSTNCTDFTNLSKTNPSQAALIMKDKILKNIDLIPSLAGKIKTGGRVNALKTVLGIQTFCNTCTQPSSIKIESTTASTKIMMKTTGANISAQYKKTNSTTWTVVQSPTIPLILTGLDKCSDYDLEIKTLCGPITSSTYATVFKAGGCCVSPSEITVLSAKNNQVSVNFPKVDVANNYILCLKDSATGACLSNQTITDTSFIFNGLSICKNYTVNIKSTCGTQTSTDNIFNIKTSGCGPCLQTEYCASKGINPNFEWIDSIAVGNARYKSGKSQGYFSYDSVFVALKSGQKYKFTIKPGFSSGASPEAVAVWIDFNGNGNFLDAGEKVWESIKFDKTMTDSFSIPQISQNQTVKMRLAMKFVGQDANPKAPESCETFANGEVEDYCVTLERSSSLAILPQSDIDIFPNPFSNTITIRNMNTDNHLKNIQLLSTDGRILFKENIQTIDNEYVITKLPPLSMGIYFMKIESQQGVLVKKIVKSF
jgi:serine protease